MINPMQLMQMLQGGNPMQLMNMFSNRPEFQMAQKMMNNGNPEETARNLLSQLPPDKQEQAKQFAQQLGIKL